MLLPAGASAVTVDQIVALSKAGVSETIILALLDRDRTVLTIDPEQLVVLKREGLSDAVIAAMLKNGREEGEQAARAVSAERAAAILPTLTAAPEVAIVGHGPDRPNTVHTEDLYDGFRDGVALPPAFPRGSVFAIPYGPYGGAFPLAAPSSRRASASRKSAQRSGGALCLAQVNTPRGDGPAYVTECPASIPPRQGRADGASPR
jgi:hypothetical protein